MLRYLDNQLALTLTEDEVTQLLDDGNDDTQILNYLTRLTTSKKNQRPQRVRGFFRFTK